MPAARERRARVATTAIFFATGWVYAAWATRIPAIKDELELSSGELGLAVLGLEGGARCRPLAGRRVRDAVRRLVAAAITAGASANPARPPTREVTNNAAG